MKYKATLLYIILIFTTSCSNNKLTDSDVNPHTSVSEGHIRNAEMDERTAKIYRDQGVNHMADYYNAEAQRERKASIDSSCDLIDIFLSIVTLGFFDCK